MWIHLLALKLIKGASDVVSTNIPILKLITNRMETLIDTYMTQANGFSLDYGSINEYDNASITYPAVYLEYPDEYDQEFDLQDRYSERTELIIRVVAASTADLNKTAHWIKNDFGLLFESFKGDLKTKGLILYDFIRGEMGFSNVAAYPVEMKLRYSLKYRRVASDLYTPDTDATAETFSGSAFSSSYTPVFIKVVDQIETIIANMTVANGYNFDYGTVNEYNNDDIVYPAVYLEYPEEEGLSEDDENSSKVGYYEGETPLMIKVISATSSDIVKTNFLVRSDFNKMFFDYRDTLRVAEMDSSESVSASNKYDMVAAYPTTIILNYLINHSRVKDNPYNI